MLLIHVILLCFSIIQHKNGCSHKNWGENFFCTTHTAKNNSQNNRFGSFNPVFSPGRLSVAGRYPFIILSVAAAILLPVFSPGPFSVSALYAFAIVSVSADIP